MIANIKFGSISFSPGEKRQKSRRTKFVLKAQNLLKIISKASKIDHMNAHMSALWFTKKTLDACLLFSEIYTFKLTIQFPKNVKSVTTVVFCLYSSIAFASPYVLIASIVVNYC